MKRLLLALIAMLAPVILLELGLRLFGYNPFADLLNGRELILREARNSAQVYELTPGARGKAWGSQVSINSLGFRGREYTRAKPEGTFRIVVLGDSITFGNHLPLEATYADQLEKLLIQDAPTNEVLNLGVGGYSTAQEAALLAELGVSLEPDLVILGFCLNDLGVVSTNRTYIKRARTYGQSALYRARVAQWVQVQLDNIAATRHEREFLEVAPGSDPLDPETTQLQSRLAEGLAGLEDPPQFLDWYASPARIAHLRVELERIRALAQENDFPILAVIFPYLEDDPLYQFAYRILEYEFARVGIATINVYEDFRVEGFERLQRGKNGDSVHPNREGHEIVTRRIKAYLEAKGMDPTLRPTTTSSAAATPTGLELGMEP